MKTKVQSVNHQAWCPARWSCVRSSKYEGGHNAGTLHSAWQCPVFPHRRWRWAAFLQRCNNVAQRLSNVLQRWYNVAISCATQHNVVQRDQAMLYFPQRCTALSKRCHTLASVAKPLSNVFQRCRDTWQFAASRWRQAACLQRCNNVAQQVPDAVQRRYKVGQRSTTMRNIA